MNNIKLSIIIVNYNTLSLTKACIDSIIEKTEGVEYEIIVVDNNSTDGSKEFFSNDKRITFIEVGDNIGFGKANNLGCQYAKGEYIFFLNSDTLLLNNAVKIFRDYAECHRDERLGAIGCLLQDGDGQRCHSYAKLTTASDILKSYFIAPFSKRKAKKFIGADAEDENREEIDVGYVTGADIFVHRSVLEVCGAYDPDFFMYSEEAEMQLRFKKKGFRNVVIKTPKIVHLEGMSQVKKKSPTIKKVLMTQRSLFLYVKKTSSSFTYALFRLLFPFTRIPFLLFSKRPIRDKTTYVNFLISKL